jgi:hypothetical protein
MDDFERVVIEETIKSQVGRSAKYERYDEQSPNSLMRRVLLEAERTASEKFSVYCVSDGLAENFFLSGFSVTPVVFDSRYLELFDYGRKLFDDALSAFRVELAERACLTMMADLSLRHGSPEFAALAFVKSIIGAKIFIPYMDMLEDLEIRPVNAHSIFTWFFGLTHELGHLVAGRLSKRGWRFTDDWIRGAIVNALQIFPYPSSIKRKALDMAEQDRSFHVLGFDHLRHEGVADQFASGVLIDSTRALMKEFSEEEFNLGPCIMQAIISLNIIALIQKCKHLAMLASAGKPSSDAEIDLLLQPVAMYVRTLMLSDYLAFITAVQLSSSLLPPADRVAEGEEWVSKAFDTLRPAINDIETGLTRAQRFALYPNERDPNLMVQFVEEVHGNRGPLVKIAAKRFWDLSTSLGLTGQHLDFLQSAISN